MRRGRVLLADDHALVIEGFRRILESEFDVIGAVEDGKTLVSEALRLTPDVILIDISCPFSTASRPHGGSEKTCRRPRSFSSQCMRTGRISGTRFVWGLRVSPQELGRKRVAESRSRGSVRADLFGARARQHNPGPATKEGL